jgi:hypothetical protein
MSKEHEAHVSALARVEDPRRAIAPKKRNVIARGWARLGDSRALIVGGLVLGGAVVWGAAQAGLASAVLYRLFRKRHPREEPVKKAVGAIADRSLRRVARAVIPPTSPPALAIRIAEVLAISYFAYRAIQGRRNAQRQLAAGPRPFELPAASSSGLPSYHLGASTSSDGS